MITAKDVRKGNILKWKDGLWFVYDTQHITPGNWRGYAVIKMRNIESGSMHEERFRSDEKFEPAHIEQKDVEYLYPEGEQLVFMDQKSYEQVHVAKDFIGDDLQWLKANTQMKLNWHENRAVGVELPHVVELEVVDCEPGLKSATITNVYKAAKLETGAVVQVPPFIEKGEVIRIDTRTGQYLERASK